MRISASELSNILKLISLPGGGDYLMDKVAPTFHPDGKISLMAKGSGTVEDVTFTGLKVTGIGEPTAVQIKCSHVLDRLSIFNGTEEVTLEYNSNEKIILLYNDTGKMIRMSTLVKEEDEDNPVVVLNEFPFHIEGDDIKFKGGTVPATIFTDIPVEKLRDLIGYVDKIGIDPKIYKLNFQQPNKVALTAGDPTQRDRDTIEDVFEVPSLVGEGFVAYGLGFENVFKNLDGFVTIQTVPGGPLWVISKTDKYSCRYLISPAAKEFL